VLDPLRAQSRRVQPFPGVCPRKRLRRGRRAGHSVSTPERHLRPSGGPLSVKRGPGGSRQGAGPPQGGRTSPGALDRSGRRGPVRLSESPWGALLRTSQELRPAYRVNLRNGGRSVRQLGLELSLRNLEDGGMGRRSRAKRAAGRFPAAPVAPSIAEEDPVMRLVHAARAEALAVRGLDSAVAGCRAAGYSWALIGRILGLTSEGARGRWGRHA
jgi:hypothetical protein